MSGQPRRPRRLRRGDTVAVVAPAGPVVPELLTTGVEQLAAWGLRVRLGEHVRDRHPRLDHLAGTEANRAEDFQRAWCDPEVAAVFCARGGYGSQRMVDRLDFAALAAAGPKVLVGSSDITALHQAVTHRLGLVTIFGPMVGTEAFVRDEPAREHLRRTLFTPEEVTTITAPDAAPLRPGRARGITCGGNLSLLASSVGTAHAPPAPKNSLALLEDVTEQPYRLDGFLTQLSRAGWFDGVVGVALGSWVECGPPEEVRAVLADLLGPLGVPILHDLGFGHCTAQRTVPLGVVAELDADAGELRVAEPALAE